MADGAVAQNDGALQTLSFSSHRIFPSISQFLFIRLPSSLIFSLTIYIRKPSKLKAPNHFSASRIPLSILLSRMSLSSSLQLSPFNRKCVWIVGSLCELVLVCCASSMCEYVSEECQRVWMAVREIEAANAVLACFSCCPLFLFFFVWLFLIFLKVELSLIKMGQY